MGWFETALKTVEADDDNDEVIPQIEIKSQLKSKFAHLSKDSSTEESPSIMQKDEGLSTEPVIATLGKDVGLRIYFAVGVLALLIGYFGWRSTKKQLEEDMIQKRRLFPQLKRQCMEIAKTFLILQSSVQKKCKFGFGRANSRNYQKNGK